MAKGKRKWMRKAKELKSTLKTDIRNNLYAVLLGQLSGIKNTSKARQAYQQFMHESASEVAKAVDERWAENWIKPDGSANTKGPNVHFRAQVACELFAEMSDDEKEGYRTRAAAEATAAKEAYKSALEKGPSKDPASQQRCINQFRKFMGPIMKGVQEYTGLQGFVVLGGPMPKYNREVGTLHLTVGRNQAAAPTTFPGYDGHQCDALIDVYTKYLGTVYLSQDCAEAALPSEGSLNNAAYSFNDDEFDAGSDDMTDSLSDSDSSSEPDEEARGKRKERKAEAARKRKEGKKVVNGKKRKADTQSGSSDRAAKKTKTKAKSAEEETREKERLAMEVSAAAEKQRLHEANMEKRATNECAHLAALERNRALMREMDNKAAENLIAWGIKPPTAWMHKEKAKRVRHPKPVPTGPPTTIRAACHGRRRRWKQRRRGRRRGR
ncbi:hypothetical protein B0H14DRAFT_2626821 [Mycena olivaceomarginata]|nr:hypothetical protein B0H14DRAFT_2626821 [Mycena olivaceomarginata]